MKHRRTRRNRHSFVPPSLADTPRADTMRTRSREYRGRRASLPRSDPLRVPVSPPRGTHRSTAADYTSGCPAIVTLALLIACPTKVYHYHRHPSCPPSALNPLVSRCTYCSVFLSLRRRSLLPSATYHSLRDRLPLPPPGPFSLFHCTCSAPFFITTRTHTQSYLACVF